MAALRRCPRCGNTLPPDVGQGLCPACLLGAGLEPASEEPPGEELTFGFEPIHPGHVLESLARSIGSIPRVLLPDTANDDAGVAVIKPSSDEMPAPAEGGSRYQLFGEIARGEWGRSSRARSRPGPRPGGQGLAREPPGQTPVGAPVRGGSTNRRPAPAPRHRAGLRAGRLRRPPALLHDEAGERPDALGAAGGAPAFRSNIQA